MNYENLQEFWKGHEDGYCNKQYNNPFKNESVQFLAYANGFQTGRLEKDLERDMKNHE